ncbi:hypothetical protein O181_014805 [Austropuccinia psidii MF-1]|uniref:Uncharacterized protein n=1 Tax=Austropuccinia psidii MF-1 TaxID=1389203 RepID=A0A9Q3GQA6_9BASI|nr:hypothetical protein [Austropuccinia psidii MF-1]
MPQTPGNSTEFNELKTSAPENGGEISDMVSSHELGIEVESLAHESNPDPPVLPECENRFILNICSVSKPDTFFIAFISAQPPSSQKPNFKSYEKEKPVEPFAPTEDKGRGDALKIRNDSKIPDYVHQKIAEPMSLLKMYLNQLGKRPNTNATKKTNKKHHTFQAAKDSRDQGNDMINVEVDHIDHEPPHTERSSIPNETIYDETPPASPQNIEASQERDTIKHDKMGKDMTDIMPDTEPAASSSANFQGIFLSCIQEFGDILNYHPNITQQSLKRGLDNINSIYKN